MKILISVVIFIFTLALGWGVTVGIIYAICALLGWDFSIMVATAIWLVMFLLKEIMCSGKNIDF